MKMKRIIAMMVALMLLGTAALAMPVRSGEGKLTLSCAGEDGNISIDAKEFQLIGVGEDGKYLIHTDDGYYSLLAVMRTLTQEELDRINEMSSVREADFQPLTRGTRTDAVTAFQTALSDLGFFEGTVDGDYGAKTQNAVNALQEELGLEKTGIADARLQMLVLSMNQPELVLGNAAEVDGMTESIAQAAGIDPQLLKDNNLQLEYDDITGVGFLSNGNEITYEAPATSDIDACTLTLRFGLYVRDNGDGTSAINPAVKVACLCVRRPVIEEITIKSGSSRGTAPIEDVYTELDGVKTEENGIAILDGRMIEALAGAKDAGELKVRVGGRYNSFDVRIEKSQLAALAAIGGVAKAMQN